MKEFLRCSNARLRRIASSSPAGPPSNWARTNATRSLAVECRPPAPTRSARCHGAAGRPRRTCPRAERSERLPSTVTTVSLMPNGAQISRLTRLSYSVPARRARASPSSPAPRLE
nr:hypothetical protein [Streptomyces sp. NRRL F-2580]